MISINILSLLLRKVRGFPLSVHTKLSVRDYELNPRSPILRIARAGEVMSGQLPGADWTVFFGNHSIYQALSWARMKLDSASDSELVIGGELVAGSAESESSKGEVLRYVPVIHDRGSFDGVQRVIFGSGLQLFLHRLLFVDALSYLSHGKLSAPLERYVMVDIDDIFVGMPGIRLKPADVKVC